MADGWLMDGPTCDRCTHRHPLAPTCARARPLAPVPFNSRRRPLRLYVAGRYSTYVVGALVAIKVIATRPLLLQSVHASPLGAGLKRGCTYGFNKKHHHNRHGCWHAYRQRVAKYGWQGPRGALGNAGYVGVHCNH